MDGDVAACFVDSGSNVRTLEIITLLCFVFVAFNKRATVASSRPAACSWTQLNWTELPKQAKVLYSAG